MELSPLPSSPKSISTQQPPSAKEIPPHFQRFFTGEARKYGPQKVQTYKLSTCWWIASTAFPLLAGTFGPIANLFSACALVQTWRIDKETGDRISDPKWTLALNSISLGFAVIANCFLLLNFAHRVRYHVAQLVTITLWYISSLFLLVPLAMLTARIFDEDHHTHSQSYYYGIIAAAIYATISTFLLLNVIGASEISIPVPGTTTHLHLSRRHYRASFRVLSIPQRTMMLQTISFVLYLAVMAGVFAALENWSFVDALYWADYTLLTIGLGSDFTPQTTAGRFLLIPFSLFGFTLLGLVVNSVRRLLVERAREKRKSRNLFTRREKWGHRFDESAGAGGGKGESAASDDYEGWLKREFELMRHIESASDRLDKYSSVGVALLGFIIVWLGGSLVFWSCEDGEQGWSLPNAIYFAYVSITTIGFGDFYPTSSAGKPFFVLWSLIAVPIVTALIGAAGNTVGSVVETTTVWFWKNTILPEPPDHTDASGNGRDYGPEESSTDSEGDGYHVTSEGEEERRDQVGSRSPKRARLVKRDKLILKLSKEMVKLVGDLTQEDDPAEKKYAWEEWKRWLRLLEKISEDEEKVERDEEKEAEQGQGQGGPSAGPGPFQSRDHGSPLEKPSPDRPGDSPRERSGREREREWAWLWLSDQGPLFSQAPEPKWIMEKLNSMLERVLSREEDVLRENMQSKHRRLHRDRPGSSD